MPDVRVVHRQPTKDLLLVRLQLCQKILELYMVEDFTGSEGPCVLQFSLSGGRNSREDHFAEVKLRPFLNAHRIGNSVCLIVIRWKRIKLCLEVAAMSVFFAGAVPGRFDLHAIGGIPVLDPKQAVQREFRHECVSCPMDSFPAIYRAWR